MDWDHNPAMPVRQIGFAVGPPEAVGSAAGRSELPESPLKRMFSQPEASRLLRLPQLKLGSPKAMKKSTSLISMRHDDCAHGSSCLRLSRSTDPIAIPYRSIEAAPSHEVAPAAQLLEEAQASAEPHAAGSTQVVDVPSASQLHPPAAQILRAVEQQLRQSQDQALQLVQHLRLELEHQEEMRAECAAQRQHSDPDLCFDLDLNDRCQVQIMPAMVEVQQAAS